MGHITKARRRRPIENQLRSQDSGVGLRRLKRRRNLGAVVGDRAFHRGQLLQEHGHLWERLYLQELGALDDAVEERVVRARLHWGVTVLDRTTPGVAFIGGGTTKAWASAVR